MPRGPNWPSPICPASPTSAACGNLVEPKGAKMIYPCDVQNSEDIVRTFEMVKATYGRLDFLVHSIAFAPPLEFKNPYVNMSRAGWHLAMDISVYSLVAVCRQAAPLMTDGGSIITVSYYGGEKVVPGYNVMGVCKAALEHSVRYLAWDLGQPEDPRERHQRRADADAQLGRHFALRQDAAARREEVALGPRRRNGGPRQHRRLSAQPPLRRRHRRDPAR